MRLYVQPISCWQAEHFVVLPVMVGADGVLPRVLTEWVRT